LPDEGISSRHLRQNRMKSPAIVTVSLTCQHFTVRLTEAVVSGKS